VSGVDVSGVDVSGVAPPGPTVGRGSHVVWEGVRDPGEARRLIDILEAEVNNWGFDLFFFNSSGERPHG
jgi:hypothetical protein